MTKFAPIPNMTTLRSGKPGYDMRYTIDVDHPLHNDPLVDPREHQEFADASSYYSKPNRMTGEVLPGVPNQPLVRHDVLKRLLRVEHFLHSDEEVRDALGAPAHLKIDDALRSYEAQKFAYEIAWPQIISRQHPELSQDEVATMVPKYCAKPAAVPTPTPHLTGGAVDVALTNLETGMPFDRGHVSGKVQGTAFPDFHEGYHVAEGLSDIMAGPDQADVIKSKEVVLGRRILYYAMTKVGGLYVNPNEIWHYGIGDPLSAYVSGAGDPYYGIASLSEHYGQQ